jgi:hypothetical protein
MDPERLRQTYARLQNLDERLTHRVRPSRGLPLTRPAAERLESDLRVLAEYTVELKDILEELILALGSRPKPATAPAPPV